eukprot:jgi/Orpsp1_1/1192609/evm.model.d7180000094593.1
MRFNHVKGLLTSALFCAFYANAQEYQNECNKLNEGRQITSECKEDHYGFITEMALTTNVEVDEGVFADLTSLEKLTIFDRQANLVDYNYEEIASLPNLTELHLNCERCIDDINVFKKLKNLSYLDLRYYDGEVDLDGFKNLKKLDLTYRELEQEQINDIGKLSNLEELSIQLDYGTINYDLKPIKNLKRLTSLHIQGEEDERTYYLGLSESNLEGFTNLKKLSLSHISLSEKDISNIASMKKLESLKLET